MKGQSALEYLMVIAITLIALVPTAFIFYNYSRDSTSEIVYPQIQEIGRVIIDNSQSIYYSGENSKIIIDVRMPKELENAYILHNRELVFNVSTESETTEMIFFSEVNISSNDCSGNWCNLSEIAGSGLKKIKIESFDNGRKILISKV